MSSHALRRLGPGPRLSGSLGSPVGSPPGPASQHSLSARLAEEERRTLDRDGMWGKGAAEWGEGDAPAPIAEVQESG